MEDWLKDVAAAAVIEEEAFVDVHVFIRRLIVQRNYVTQTKPLIVSHAKHLLRSFPYMYLILLATVCMSDC